MTLSWWPCHKIVSVTFLIWLTTLHQVLTKWIFTCSLCFQSQRIRFLHFYRAAMFVWPRKSKSTSCSTSDSGVNLGYWWLSCLYFCCFVIFHVFDVKESFCAVLRSYHVWVISKIQVNSRFCKCLRILIFWGLWIFVIPFSPMSMKSKNPFFAVPMSCHVWVKIQDDFWFCRCSRLLMIVSYKFP